MSSSLNRRISWLQVGERGVIAWAMGLVITGQMLPSGAVAAQEPAPTLVIPADTVPPAPPVPEAPAAEVPAAAAPAAATPTVEAAPPAVATEPLPTISPAIVAVPQPQDEMKYSFNDWTMTIRPAPKTVVRQPQIIHRVNAPMSHVQVPVNVQVNNAVPSLPVMWNPNFTYSSWWTAPTSAYLFERPQPYWKLRGDFDQLRPFIRW